VFGAFKIAISRSLEGEFSGFRDYHLKDSCVYSLGRRAVAGGPQTVGSTTGEDSALVAAVLRKDRKATAEFVARHADSIYGYVRSRLAPRYDLADDLVQEVFLAAWENLGQYRGTGPLLGWMMAIARHKVENHYRERLHAPVSIEISNGGPASAVAVPEFQESLERDQLRERTWRVLADMPEPYRLALIWRYWEKAPAREMAQKTGRTEKAIERLLARARAEFRERWHHGQKS
jgi:RNA polymerase sigma-70 factor, ECF subfamily